MALIKCPECGNDISSEAIKCIKCGYPINKHVSNDKQGNSLNKPRTNKKFVAVGMLIIVIILGVVGYKLLDMAKGDPLRGVELGMSYKDVKEAETAEVYSENETEGFIKYTITDYKYAQEEKVESIYTFENDKLISVFMLISSENYQENLENIYLEFDEVYGEAAEVSSFGKEWKNEDMTIEVSSLIEGFLTITFNKSE